MASWAARLDKPGIDAAPVSRLLSPAGLILPALCCAFLSLAPQVSQAAPPPACLLLTLANSASRISQSMDGLWGFGEILLT